MHGADVIPALLGTFLEEERRGVCRYGQGSKTRLYDGNARALGVGGTEKTEFLSSDLMAQEGPCPSAWLTRLGDRRAATLRPVE